MKQAPLTNTGPAPAPAPVEAAGEAPDDEERRAEFVDNLVDVEEGPPENVGASVASAAPRHPNVHMASSWSNVVIDARKVLGLPESCPILRLPGGEVSSSSESRIFLNFLPMDYFNDVCLRETNDSIPGFDLTPGEFIRYLGVCLLMTAYPGVPKKEFFSPEPQSMYNVHPYISPDIMTRDRFFAITSSLKLTDEKATYADRFLHVRKLIDAFNSNMQKCFTPGFMNCFDESVVEWLTEHTCPGWRFLPRKPHQFGNEYFTLADAVTKIIYSIELSEGKDHPPQRPLKEPNFPGKPTVSLLHRLTKPIWHTGSVVVLDSGFCVLEGLTTLSRDRGVFASAVIKKRRYWPSGVDGDGMDRAVEGRPFGFSTTLTGKWKEHGKADADFYLLAMKDTNHVLKLMATYGTNTPSGTPHGRSNPDAPGYISITYPDLVERYYKARHAVDDNNNVRQGSFSFEKLMGSRHWHIRQMHFLIALAETNAFQAFSYFVRRDHIKFCDDTLRSFRLSLARQLIEHPLFFEERAQVGAKDVSSPRELRSGVEELGHALVVAPPFSGAFDGEAFREVQQRYQKHKCRGGNCHKTIRTYCSCNTGFWLCSGCYTIHIREIFSHLSK